ncbi:MAG: sodium:proton antiporter [Planctomycetota bacterium]|nr:sodium:proton antiporter [Planctomycetota bacterium]
MMMYALAAVLLGVGLYGLLVKRHLLKKVLGLLIVEHAVNLFLIQLGYIDGGIAPIRTAGEEAAAFVGNAVDPLPQVLVLTSIVIGLGLAMLMVALTLRIYQRYGSLDADRMSELKG